MADTLFRAGTTIWDVHIPGPRSYDQPSITIIDTGTSRIDEDYGDHTRPPQVINMRMWDLGELESMIHVLRSIHEYLTPEPAPVQTEEIDF